MLLVDDDQAVLHLFTEILHLHGYLVIAKRDPVRALTILAERALVHVIVADDAMPRMGVLEFIKRIREMTPATPVIVLTASGSSDACSQCLNLGAYAYLHKPVPMATLEQLVRAAISEGREAAGIVSRQGDVSCGFTRGSGAGKTPDGPP